MFEPLALAVVATLLAGVIRTSVGIGAGILLTATLLLLFDARMTLAITAFLQIGFGLSAVCHYWRKWDGALVLRLGCSALAGVLLGCWLISILPPEWIRRAIGVGLIAFALFELLRSRELVPQAPPHGGVITGFASGVAGSMVNACGAVLALYLKRLPLSYDAFLGTLSAVVLWADLVRLGLFWHSGLLNERALIFAIVLLPVVFGGGWLGMQVRGRVKEHVLRRAVLSLVAVIGIILLV